MKSKRVLQAAVLLLSLRPLAFGLTGILFGTARFTGSGAVVNINLDNQIRFLSAWYLGLAALAWWCLWPSCCFRC
jgi:Domain of unknown function (DUF4345)